MQKRYVSTFLFLILLLMAIPFGNVFAQTHTELLFDLDLSGYNEATKAGLNNAVNSDTVFTVNGNPSLHSFVSALGTTKYITFATGRDTSREATIFAEESSVLNKDELTIEMWAKGFISTQGGTNGRPGCTGRLFAIGDGATAPFVSTEIMVYNGLFFFRPGRNPSNGLLEKQYSMTQYNEQWTHFVFTRKWKENESAWEYQTYANGQKIAVGCGQADGNQVDESQMKLCIGGNGETLGGMQGSISTFKVYGGIMSDEDISKAYNEQMLGYAVLPDSLEIESISPNPETETLDCNPGEITVRLNNYVDSALVSSAVALKDSDGIESRGGIEIISDSKTTKEFKIRYGRLLPSESYTLNINDLQSINGCFLTEEIEYNSYHDYDYIFSEDFEGDEYVVDQPAPVDAGLKMISDGVEDDSSKIIVRQTEDGDKYLELTASAGMITTVTKSFSPVSAGETVMEIVARPDSKRGGGHRGTALRTIGNIVTDAGTVTLAKAHTSGANAVYGYIAGGNLQSGEDFYYESLKVNDDFHHMKYIIKKDKDGSFSYTAENMDVPDGWAYEGNLLSGTGETYFNAVELGKVTPAGEDQITDSIQLCNIKVYRVFHPGVLKTNIPSMTPDDSQLQITFDDDMVKENFTDGAVKLKSTGSGKKVELNNLNYDEESRTFTADMADYLDYGETYELSFSGLENMRGEAMKEDYVLALQTMPYDLSVESINGISVKNNTNKQKNIQCFFVVYDSTGRIKTIVEIPETLAPYQSKAIPVNETKGNLYIWDITDEITRPLLSEPIAIGS